MTTTPVAQQQASLSELVAEEIRSWMGRRRMTGARLARELGVSPAWVSYRLTGVQPIDLNDLAKIAQVLSVPVVALLPASAREEGSVTLRYSRGVNRTRANGGKRHPAPRTGQRGKPIVDLTHPAGRAEPVATAPKIRRPVVRALRPAA